MLLKMRSLSASIPEVALPFFAEAILVAADAVSRFRGDKSWGLWLMAPTLLLWQPRGNISEVARAKYVATRAVWFVQGRVRHLWETIKKVMEAYQARERSAAHGKQRAASEEFDAKRFTFLMTNGRVAEALDVGLGVRGVRKSFKDGQLDDASRDLIARKVPQVAEPPRWGLSREEFIQELNQKYSAPVQVDVETVHALYSGVTASKRHGTGGSFSGWTFDMLYNAFRVPSLPCRC